MLAGCVAGVPLGATILHSFDAGALRTGTGLLLIGYSLFVLFVARVPTLSLSGRRAAVADGILGFLSGMLGGATNLNGVLTVIWARLRGWSKIEQRAVVQPFILFCHALTLAFLGTVGSLTLETGIDIQLCLPALTVGGWIGLRAFHRISDIASTEWCSGCCSYQDRR